MACPECGFDHPGLSKYAGKTLKCPKCGVAFKVVAESPLELSEPSPAPPPRPATSVSVPSPAAPLQPVTYATTARRAAGVGGVKAATGGIGGLIALALIALRISSGCDRASSRDCVRFNEQIVAAVKPVEEGFKSLGVAADRMSDEGREGEFQTTLNHLQGVCSSGRTRLSGIKPLSEKGAPEFLQAARAYVEAADALTATMLAGKFDAAAISALQQARERTLASQKAFMDQNGLVETR